MAKGGSWTTSFPLIVCFANDCQALVERLWRSLKYECVYLHAWETGSEARVGIAKWVEFYNHKRPHSAHGGKPPAVVYWFEKEGMQPDQQEQKVA